MTTAKNKTSLQAPISKSDDSSLDLNDLRSQIDRVDQELIPLLDKRAALVFKVGQWKKLNGKEIFDPHREKQILDKLALLPRETLNSFEIESLFKTIIDFFRSAESAHQNIEDAKKMSFLPQQGTFGFVGFGLIGASVALALKNIYPTWNFHIYDPFINLDEFKEWKLIQEKKSKISYDSFQLVELNSLKNMNCVFLSAPIDVNKTLAPELINKNDLVLNLGSFQEDLPSVIGFHPLAGKEVSGFKNAQSDLFYKKWIYISCPDNFKHLTDLEQAILKQISMSLGAEVFYGNNQDHNKSLAYSSHLLQLLSMIYGLTLDQQHENLNFHVVPKSGWEFLRLNGSDFHMWEPVFKMNKVNILKSLEGFEQNLIIVKNLLLNSENENTPSSANANANADKVKFSLDSIKNLFIKGHEIYNNLYLRKRKGP